MRRGRNRLEEEEEVEEGEKGVGEGCEAIVGGSSLSPSCMTESTTQYHSSHCDTQKARAKYERGGGWDGREEEEGKKTHIIVISVWRQRLFG